jgi:hypothetical protein
MASRDVRFANNVIKLSASATQPVFEIPSGGLVGILQTAANRYFHPGNTASSKMVASAANSPEA